MDKLDYARPETTTAAAPSSTAAVLSSVAAWLAFLVVCVSGTGWPILLFPILSLVAIGFGVAGRRASGPGPSPGRTRATLGLWVGVVQLSLFGAGLVLLPRLGGTREPAGRMKCASNLRQIGQGIQMYANEHRGALPPTLDAMLTNGDFTSEVFICPSTGHDRAEGATTQAVVANFRADPKHCSYVYAPGAQTGATLTAAYVLAYEHATNHKQDGMNVLYGDGTVQWLDAKTAAQLLSELNAGHNPPR